MILQLLWGPHASSSASIFLLSSNCIWLFLSWCRFIFNSSKGCKSYQISIISNQRGYPNARLGSRKGFKNIAKAQCHAVATAIMNAADAAVHENVKGYDGTHLEKNCTHCIDMAEQLFFE